MKRAQGSIEAITLSGPAKQLEPAWTAVVRAALADAPEPAAAAALADSLLEVRVSDTGQSLAERLGELPAERANDIARIFAGLCGVAPFLVPHFLRHPAWILELIDDDLTQPRDRETQRHSLKATLGRNAAADPAAGLRRFKYQELARLTIRDASAGWVPLAESDMTLREISQLADALLGGALSLASASLRETIGPPRWRTVIGDHVELGFCVLGLGKLGSEELNYSSDVDLVYIHASPPDPLDLGAGEADDALSSLAPPDYFTRLAQAFGKLVTPVTVDGFLYRIDLDLRPEGAQGAIVTSVDALATYYEAWADTWERAAFMKARPVAGDIELGWRAINDVAPMIYHSTMDYGAVASIRSLKQKVEDRHGGSESGWNVKIDAGGIRDVEFVAQALQLLHGGRIPQLRERSTQRALQSLGDVGLLSRDQSSQLLDAYRFLRRTENRIQMEDERQRHVVPGTPRARLRLARAMGFVGKDAEQRFDAALEAARTEVKSIVGSTFGETASDRILELFLRNVPQLVAEPTTRGMIEALAGQFAQSIDASSDPERALNNLDRFVQGIGSRRFYYELLLDRPELVARLTSLFSSSKFLSGYLASHPRLIEPVFADADVLLLTRAELEADLAATGDACGDDAEAAHDALRIFQHRQILNVGLLDIADKVARDEAETSLTEIAEVCLDEALRLANAQLASSRDGTPAAAARGAYLVIGMGKLGSRELSYGSDLDLVFLYDVLPEDVDETPLAQHHFVRLTQRLISILQTPTSEGACYEIDARLRPSGNQGTLVSSLTAFRRYHDKNAEVWERQALLRARAVAGDKRLAERFESARREILARPLPGGLAAEIHRVRQRMEVELARETGRRRNFKTGRGGILDIETVVQYLLLRNGADHPELIEVNRLEVQLRELHALELIGSEDADTLLAGWTFLQTLGSRLRIAENRSISDLDGERGDLESLALQLGYESTGREGGARRALLRDYQHHTEAIRCVYERILREAA
ncbi:MAG: hypothetical protein JRG92_08810 [Deltaproteobacteria bacterium]|nr:hypothetical protein [Deltaproteobacteria bacterium]